MSAAITFIVNSRTFTSGFVVGGVTMGFISYGFGLIRGGNRYVSLLDNRIRAINEEKVRDANSRGVNARGASNPENIQ